MEVLKIKKLKENAVIPKRATTGSAGMDLYACIENEVTIEPGKLTIIPTGIAIALPSENYMANIYARSGLGVKHGICLSNGVGVIDSDYRGEVCVGLCNVSDTPYIVQPNERVAQLVIAPVSVMQTEEVLTLDETERGSGGFGSTGKN
ncbi:MAG: dUTP diphosphatase [Ruminococcus sp.]|nr:dUTP diphosphatase [Ruminococcus sp.]